MVKASVYYYYQYYFFFSRRNLRVGTVMSQIALHFRRCGSVKVLETSSVFAFCRIQCSPFLLIKKLTRPKQTVLKSMMSLRGAITGVATCYYRVFFWCSERLLTVRVTILIVWEVNLLTQLKLFLFSVPLKHYRLHLHYMENSPAFSSLAECL